MDGDTREYGIVDVVLAVLESERRKCSAGADSGVGQCRWGNHYRQLLAWTTAVVAGVVVVILEGAQRSQGADLEDTPGASECRLGRLLSVVLDLPRS